MQAGSRPSTTTGTTATAGTTTTGTTTAVDLDAGADPVTLVDLDCYPVLDLDSPAGQQVVADGRNQLAGRGAAELPGFITKRGVARLVRDAELLAPRRHHSAGRATPYLEIPDFTLPADHPRLTWGDYAVGAVAYDLIPTTSPLRRLFEWQPLTDFIAALLDRGPLYPYADPFGALNLSVMEAGDELEWHFDQSDFVVSLAIQTAATGGDFEVAPRIRSGDDERYAEVAAVLAGDTGPVVTLPMTPGTLLVFEGRHSLHRVSPIQGQTLRHVGLLAYDTSPGRMGSDLLRQDRYGRVTPFDRPPDAWPLP